LKPPLKVLIVEDLPDDALLLVRALKKLGYEVEWKQVETAPELRAALGHKTWDIVFVDYKLPRFSGPAALQIIERMNLDLPTIVVSGTVGEDVAVETMKIGAHDYLMKDNLKRLGPVVMRELREANIRKERKKIENQLLQAQKMEAIGRLAGGIAHDFNNVLTIVSTYNGFVIEELDQGHAALADALVIHDAVRRAALVVKKLMTFSKGQTQQLETLDLNALLRDLIEIIKPAVREDIAINLIADETLGPVKADKSQMEQVIMNLALNARDAMPLGGSFTIETRNTTLDDRAARRIDLLAGAYIELRVMDTGVGMDSKTCSQVFEPFFTTKDPDKGTGLGLSSTYGIIQQSRGHISVASQPGKGTVFTILLPRFSNRLASEIPPRPPAYQLQGSETILLVEDDRHVRQGVHRVLNENGYRVLDANSGLQALQICDQHEGTIHMLLTDVVMPEIDGADLAVKVQAARPRISVLWMTGYAEGKVFEKEIFKQMSGRILQKPFSPDVLLSRIRELLDTGAQPAQRGF